jgi:hypothetical protein
LRRCERGLGARQCGDADFFRAAGDGDAVRLILARDVGERGKLRDRRGGGTQRFERGMELERTAGVARIEDDGNVAGDG